jgi:hypothetical protein
MSAAEGGAGSVTERLRAVLAEALASRDATAVRAVRSALAAIGNAEAVDRTDSPTTLSTSEHFAGAASGIGSADVPRRVLSETETRAIVRAEITDRHAAAQQYDALGRGDEATRLRSEAHLLAAVLAARPTGAG